MAKFLRALGRLMLLALIPLAGVGAAWAQTPVAVEISSPEVADFPMVSFYLQASDQDGRPFYELQPADITILENGVELAPESLTRFEPGLQVILAFNSGGGMASAYENTSRFEWIKQTLLDWTAQQPAQPLDTYHLVTNDGNPARKLQNAAALFSALQIYQPNLLNTFPSSSTLTTALDIAVQPLSNPYSRRSILFITGMPRGAAVEALPAQIELAAQIGVPVNIWLVGGTDVQESYAAGLLQQLAASTGGAYHFFSGPEGLPSPEDYLGYLRFINLVSYRSAIPRAGSYDLRVLVRSEGSQLSSNTRTFQVPFSPPSPIFLSLPARIDLPYPPLENPLGLLMERIPTTQTVRILVEFPDGETRSLRESRLFVDGVLLAANNAEPFDHFTWQPLIATQTRTYALRVEVEDERGLIGSTLETQVEVGLSKPISPAPLINLTDIAPVVAAFVGFLLVAFLLGLGLRLRQRRRQTKPGARRSARADSSEHLSLLNRAAAARLVRLDEDGTPLPEGHILLQRREVTLGSDAHKAAIHFPDPSVHPLHARLVHEGSDFKILDAGSVAGTWVNFQQAPPSGQVLQHGDLIHLGRVQLRFELMRVKNLPQVKVIPYTED